MRPLRILFVARPYSVHTARWINQVADCGWDLHLFPASEDPLHADCRNLTTYYTQRDPRSRNHQSVRTRVLWPLPVAGYQAQRLAERLLPSRWKDRAEWLAYIIKRLKPDLIHALEFQAAGYLVAQTRRLLRDGFPPLVVSNWGSDILLYGPLAAHKERIKELLAAADYYTAECRRDVQLAFDYGFRGSVLPILPVAGGFDVRRMRQYMQAGPTSARRVVVLKGYQHWAGRSLVGLRALELSADALREKGLSVAVYAANHSDVELAVERMAHITGLDVEIVPPGSHEDMLRLHGRARVSIGLSISDALSTSALEALIMGSFPIQSDTSCLPEIIEENAGALMVPPEDPEAVAAAIRRAVSDDELVDKAAELNAAVAFEKLDESVVRPQVVAMYEQVAAAHTIASS
ncbi:MAG TPA: glycosyltransferase [Pyrinomonadaceae bacterium]|nr:glycosyltransferase [Pyrinomonadaceae bacterium]